MEALTLERSRAAKPVLEAAEEVLVTLTVADQLFGIPVLAVRDVLSEQPIAPVPLAPVEVVGSLNLRGRIVTAIDLRRRLGLPDTPAGRQRMALVTEFGAEFYALLVDEVGEVMTVNRTTFERTPPTLAASLSAYTEGVFRLPTKLLLLLSVPRLLAIGAAR